MIDISESLACKNACLFREGISASYVAYKQLGFDRNIRGRSAFGAAANSPLIDAMKTGDASAVRSLLSENIDVNAPAADTSTPLHWAVQANNLEIADLLIGAARTYNAKTRYNITPLSLACTNGNAAIIERLLKAGVDANSKSEDGETALMTAALNGKVDAIKDAVDTRRAGQRGGAYQGQTALMWAAGEGNAAAVAMLMEFGARRESEIESRIHSAAFRGPEQPDRSGERCCVKLGANVEDTAPDGTPRSIWPS